ncbi:uncharacterized protein LOC118481292 isoform X1 [Helianthus annuus]|uniref:uncharacterized protein LOC118481292 isoform X1 n=1 Tax=Helianthus annuus TaxID=4232 RepID=UPI00165318FC|nr:uncharacterized protein LOC118481292 isoform X1 [Helianthus annuus]
MDEEGSKIQASVAGNYLVKYGKLLQEKRCVLVSKFEIGDNLSPYRLTNHPHKLFFNFTTDIMNGDDFGGSIHGFSFTSFDVLRNHAIPPDSHVEIIGYVDGWFPMIDHTSRNDNLNKKMSLQLRDLELHIYFFEFFYTFINYVTFIIFFNRYLNVYVTLWGDYAVQMSKFMEKNPL